MKSNGLGITSLVLGILSLFLFWIPIIGLLLPILGIVFSVKQKHIHPNGIATGGLVTSIIGLVFAGIYHIIWLIVGLLFVGVLTSLF